MSFTGEHAIAHGDVLAVLRDLPSNEFDALLCDAPYGLAPRKGAKAGFMGCAWDYDVPTTEMWAEAFRVLKPGAPLLSFFGTRTYHRGVCRIEDAGFEIRDQLAYMFGSGFPKSLDVAKAIDKDAGHWRGRAGALVSGNASMTAGNYERTPKGDPVTAAAAAWAGYGSALKPAHEPIVLARKPIEGTVSENVQRWGTGALAIDACRIGYASEDDKAAAAAAQRLGQSNHGAGVGEYGLHGANAVNSLQPYLDKQHLGRWPANVLLDEAAGAVLDAQAGNRPSTPYRENIATGAVLPLSKRTAGGYSDDGGPSRFFYTAKVSTKEREHGCQSLPLRSAAQMTDSPEDSARLDSPRTGAGRGGGARNHHPTLKPISLTKWLSALIKPPTNNATLLVPFSGAGSEMIGALMAGWPMVFGIEGEAEYIEIAHARIAAWKKGAP